MNSRDFLGITVQYNIDLQRWRRCQKDEPRPFEWYLKAAQGTKPPFGTKKQHLIGQGVSRDHRKTKGLVERNLPIWKLLGKWMGMMEDIHMTLCYYFKPSHNQEPEAILLIADIFKIFEVRFYQLLNLMTRMIQ
ncbi:hypothetical protein G9A89_015831 [Geosiphon pyriformis]|nr:hypothetical protein G9A89_015831 [Geosiphon pyriformis]